MQKKSVLSLCIAVALSGNSYAETAPSEKNRPTNSCPTNISVLTEAQKAKLPAECLKQPSFLEEQWEWVAGGVAAVAAAVGLAAGGGGGGGDGGDGGSSTPSGDIIKTYSNGVTWNETKKTITFGGVTWAYTANQDGTYSLTDPASGKTMLLKKWVVDPASNAVTLSGISTDGSKAWLLDGTGKVSFTNAANWHEGNNKNIDTNGGSTSGTGNSGAIVDGDGNTINNNGDTNGTNGGTGTQVDGNTNDINNNGNNSGTSGGTGTKVDGDGNSIDNNGSNTADGEGSKGTDATGDGNDINNNGNNSGTNGGTGTKVDGDGNTIDNKGNNTADGTGSAGTDVDGDNNTINNGGENSGTNGGTGTDVDGNNNTINNGGENSGTNGGTGTDASGNGNDINNNGNNSGTGGGTGTKIDGNGNSIDNNGSNTADGEGSKGTDATGDGNDINNNGNNSGTNGGTGTKVDGDGNTIDNKGNNTADGTGSAGTDVDGDNNTINNGGENSGTNGGTGTDVDGNNNTINNGGENSGTNGGTGTDASGNGNDINNNGNNSGTGGGTGTKVDGDDNAIDNKGNNTADGEGSKGNDVDGNNNTINNGGENSGTNGGTGTNTTGDGNDIINNGTNSGTNGGTGTKVDGNGNNIDNKGNTTADGQGSKGTAVDGNDNTINNNGESSTTNGGTGTDVSGDSNDINNNGNSTTAGEGSTGTKVNGNGNTINNTGASSVKEGAIGVDIRGNNNVVNQSGKLVVDSFSTGVKVTGDANQLNLTSNEMTVTGEQATGVMVSGAASVVNLTGTMNVNTSATGINVSGTSADVKLSGTVNVVANAEDSYSQSLRFDKGTGYRGVVVSSENASAQSATNVLVDGSINVKDNRTDPMAYPNSPTDVVPYGRDMTGLDVSGAYNNVTVTGAISVEATPYHTELINNSKIKGNDNDYDDHLIGLNVSGTNNNVVVNGGVNLNSTTETSDWVIAPDMVGIAVDGAGNQVTIHGTSSLIGKSASDSFMRFATVAGGSSLVLDTDSTLTIAPQSNGSGAAVDGGSIQVKDANSKFVNKGKINSTLTGGVLNLVVESKSGAASENSGTMTMDVSPLNLSVGYAAVALAATDTGSQVSNTGDITVINNMKANKTKYISDNVYNPMSSIQGGGQIFVAGISVKSGATGSNSGTITATGGNTWGVGANDKGVVINETGGKIVHNANSATQDLTLQCSLDKACLAAVGGGMVTAAGATATNKGTITINDSGVGMYADGGTVINKGTINLENTTTPVAGTPLVGMAVTNGGTAYNDGTININASNGQAFYTDGKTGSTIHNSGTINLNGSSMASDDSHMGSTPTDKASAPASVQRVSGYVLGTSASGSAGTLNAGNNTLELDSVSVDTGFTAGTAATTQTFDNVFTGADVEGVENITSESVVWTAEGQKDANGNVDVTMTKNAYADVAGDASVNSVANALDAAYTNNELYNSLNLKTSAELDSALKQISGSKATGVSRDARILSNRFDMLADTAPVMNNGLAFNVVAKGDQRAELSNDTTYDMLALRQSLAFGGNQTLSMEYGIARLDGNGNAMSAGDNGVTGGYSQFFGLKHSLPLSEDGLSWDNALRYDVHNFDSNRAVRYGDVNKTANADTRQQYMEFRTEGSKAFKVQEALTVTPFAGLKMRHTMEDGYSEKGAGDFNLNMSSSSETAVDAVVGLKLSYAGEDGWAATASLEGGPNLSYAKSNRTASLAGAKGQTFSVEDDQQGGGVNGQAMAGVKYSAGDAHFTADAYQWQEDGVKDKGFMVNYKYTF